MIPLNITNIIIGITTIVSLMAFRSETTLRELMMNPYVIQSRGQYYRFLTSGFIHKDYMHLFVNMISFYFFGTAVENIFSVVFGALGGLYFIALYFIAIVVSDLPTFFKQKNNPGYNSLGASGGIAAIIFVFIIFEPVENICFFIALCMPGFILGTLYIIFSYYQGKKSKDGINHEAHLYGALFGLLFCLVVYPASMVSFVEQIKHWSIF